MANFQSICTSAASPSNLEGKLNDALDTLVISSMVSSSLEHAEDGTEKAELVFGIGSGDKLQVKLFNKSDMDQLQIAMAGWIDDVKHDYDLVQLAITYGSNVTRAMLIYKPEVSGSGYSVTAISTNQGDNMVTKVDLVIDNKGLSEVISDSTYGGGFFRTVLITKK